MTRYVLMIAALCTATAYAEEDVIDVPYKEVGTRFRLLGRLHEPFGKVTTIEGKLLPDRAKQVGPWFLVQRINGKATQESLRIKLDDADEMNREKTYELTGYEIGGYSGTANDAISLGVIPPQSRGFAYHTEFQVVSKHEIPAVIPSPHDFLGREALFSGTAHSDGELRGNGFSVSLYTTFPDEIVGKTIETFGRYVPLDATRQRYALVGHAKWRLVELTDQIGREVELRGVAYSAENGAKWYLRYRGTNLYVKEWNKLSHVPKNVAHGQPVVVRGLLRKQQIRDAYRLAEVGLDPKRQDAFIVENASWDALTELLEPEY